MTTRRGLVTLALAISAAGAVVAAVGKKARAGGPSTAALNERCATRLSIAILGTSPAADLMASPDPKQAIDAMLKSPDFQERFARFINTQFNDAPGGTMLEDAPYYVALRVLGDGVPWSQMFLGQYNLVPIASHVAVSDDPNGLGYFRADDWYTRYEGNEPNGIKLRTAYRIMNNVIGLKVAASTGSPSTDQSATGRHASPCNQCHFDNWYALDKVAAVLPLKGQPFNAYQGLPQEMLGGLLLANDQDIVNALVASENYSVNACRLAFKYLYGREDNQCEGPILDRCVDTFKAQKTIQSALSSIAREPGFCE
jgi:hypothetical protein